MRLIDADEWMNKMLSDTVKVEAFTSHEGTVHDVNSFIIERLYDCKTVDAVPVVRCKDCKHRPYKGQWGIEGDTICPCICDDSYYNYIPDDDWFCKSGERKEVSE